MTPQEVPTLEIYLLGGPEIRVENAPVRLETAKTLALLAYLIMRPGTHRRDALANLLWPAQDPARANRNLRRALWNIRRTLCPNPPEEVCPYLQLTRQEVAFFPREDIWLDVEQLEQRVRWALAARKDASPNGMEAPLQPLQTGLALYRGEFLEGLSVDDAPEFDLWMVGQRAYFRELALQGLQALSELQILRGECHQATLTLQRLLMLSPWSEWAHRQLMFCYALLGRRAEALAQYDRCCQALKELQTSPLPETTQLYLRIRDPQQYQLLVREGRFFSESSAIPERFPFVGRGQEHARLLSQWQRRAGITLIAGDAGVGKTRLAEEVLRHLSGRGVRILRARCYQFGGGASFQPIVDALRFYLRTRESNRDGVHGLAPVWLRELARLVPELHGGDATPSQPAMEQDRQARQRLFEAVARFLESLNADVVFFLDDLHWTDSDTLDLLRYLIPRLQHAPVWWLASYRPEDVPRGSAMWVWRRELEREGHLTTLQLSPFNEAMTLSLVGTFHGLDSSTQEQLSVVLYEESHGNAFILVERLRDWIDRGALYREGAEWRMKPGFLERFSSRQARRSEFHRDDEDAFSIPERVRSMILGRIERLPVKSQHWLEVAAVVSASFTVDLLALAARVSPADIETAMDDWLRRGLVEMDREQETLAYDFSHSLLRQVVYESIPLPARQRMHARVAVALEQQCGHAASAHEAESLAYHYLRSGNRPLAIQWLLKAGELMQERHAQGAAIELFTQALEFIPEDERALRFRALSRRERAYNQLAQRKEQAADLKVMMALAQALGDQRRLADTLRRRAEWAMRISDFVRGIEDARAAQRLAREQEDKGLVADALRIEAMCHIRMGEYARAIRCCREGVKLCQEIGDKRRESMLLGVLGIAELNCGHFDAARSYMEATLAFWQGLDDPWREAIICNNLSMLYHRIGDFGRALAMQERARTLIPQTGDMALDAHSLTSQGILFHAVGDFQRAMACYEQAMSLTEVFTDHSLESYIRICQGQSFLALHQTPKARDAFQKALFLFRTHHFSSNKPLVWLGLAQCALQEQNPTEALSMLEEARTSFEEGEDVGEDLLWALYAQAHLMLGDNDAARQALRHFEQAVASGEETELETWQIAVLVYRQLGDHDTVQRIESMLQARISAIAETLDERHRQHFLQKMANHPFLTITKASAQDEDALSESGSLGL